MRTTVISKDLLSESPLYSPCTRQDFVLLHAFDLQWETFKRDNQSHDIDDTVCTSWKKSYRQAEPCLWDEFCFLVFIFTFTTLRMAMIRLFLTIRCSHAQTIGDIHPISLMMG